MTLIEGRKALEPRILGKRSHDLDASPFDESGSEEEFLIANEGYPEEDNNRDFFSLPTLGLNYFNNLNLNLNLNLRNSSLWRIYENSSFTKPGFLSNYLGKHSDSLDIHEHDITPDSRGFFTITNFLRRHGFQSYEEDYSEEAVLERIRFKKLQQQAATQARNLVAENLLSELEFEEKQRSFVFTEEGFHKSKDNSVIRTVEEFELENINNIVEISEGKICDIDTEDTGAQEMRKSRTEVSTVNPFYNRVELSIWDKIKIGICTILLLPIRILLMLPILLLAMIISLIGMYGISLEDSQNGPLTKWRRASRWIIANVVMRGFVFCSGFIWTIKETGKRATPEEAPIFVVAPHSSYFDAYVVILLGAPSVVAKLSTKDVPVFGRLVTFTQAVYVSRESKGSRRQTLEVLKQRAQDIYHGNGMPQIFIFPEGTCSNRSSLIKFKPGAFAPQVPVQPVVVRYPNTLDTVTWTFDGPSVYRNIWYALAQPWINIEIEYLPVYVPNEAETQDPNLFGENVRRVMAASLQIPMSDYQYEDGTLLSDMRQTKLVQKLRSIHRAKKALELVGSSKECTLILQGINDINFEWVTDFQTFQREFFNVSSEDTTVPEVQAVFSYFKKGDEETADIRPYLVLTSIMYEEKLFHVADIESVLLQMYNVYPDIIDPKFKHMLEDLFEASVEIEEKHLQNENPETNQHANTKEEEKHASSRSEILKHRLTRSVQFVGLFADEVTERLPKTYPNREDRDKIPKRKHKLD